MLSDCYAPLEPLRFLPQRLDPTASTGRTALHVRLRRLAGVLLHLVRLWAGARLLPEALQGKQRQLLATGQARRFLSTLEVTVRTRGWIPPRNGAVLLAANHTSWMDSWVLDTIAAPRFVAKSEIRTWPLIGTIAQRFGAFFLVRGSFRDAARVKDAVATALRRGDPVAVFPEGTTTDGTKLEHFHPAFLQAAIDAGVPVHPVAIRYRTIDRVPTTAAAFVGKTTIFQSLLRLVQLPGLVADLTFCAPLDPKGITRRELAARSRQAIADALGFPALSPPSLHRRWQPRTPRAA